jgi:hypothetical protein
VVKSSSPGLFPAERESPQPAPEPQALWSAPPQPRPVGLKTRSGDRDPRFRSAVAGARLAGRAIDLAVGTGSCHVDASMMMRAVVGRGGRCSADGDNREIHVDLTRFLEHQRCFERLASLDRLFEVRQHDVE